MEFIKKLIQFFRKPFPEEEDEATYFKYVIGISVFVSFFLIAFEPFGIATIESRKFLICIGFGLVSFVAILFYEWVIRPLIGSRRMSSELNFGKWLLHMMGVILTISIANFLFVRLAVFGTIQWELFPAMVYGTFLIGIFPTVVLGALTLLRLEKKYEGIADEINQQRSDEEYQERENGLSLLGISIERIRYIEALQNYVKIGYLNEAEVFAEQTERATVKAILNQVAASPIVQCHRSFLVNRETILSTSGNAQGLLLTLSDCPKDIPVSRSYVSIFRE